MKHILYGQFRPINRKVDKLTMACWNRVSTSPMSHSNASDESRCSSMTFREHSVERMRIFINIVALLLASILSRSSPLQMMNFLPNSRIPTQKHTRIIQHLFSPIQIMSLNSHIPHAINYLRLTWKLLEYYFQRLKPEFRPRLKSFHHHWINLECFRTSVYRWEKTANTIFSLTFVPRCIEINRWMPCCLITFKVGRRKFNIQDLGTNCDLYNVTIFPTDNFSYVTQHVSSC